MRIKGALTAATVGIVLVGTLLLSSCRRDGQPYAPWQPYRPTKIVNFVHLGTSFRGTFFVLPTLLRDRRVWGICHLDSLAGLDGDGDGLPRGEYYINVRNCHGTIHDSASNVSVDFYINGSFLVADVSDSLYGEGWIRPLDSISFSYTFRHGDRTWGRYASLTPMDSSVAWVIGRVSASETEYSVREILRGRSQWRIDPPDYWDTIPKGKFLLKHLDLNVDSLVRTIYLPKPLLPEVGISMWWIPAPEVSFFILGRINTIVLESADDRYEDGNLLFKIYPNDRMILDIYGVPTSGTVTFGEKADGSDNENWRFVEGDPVVRDMIE